MSRARNSPCSSDTFLACALLAACNERICFSAAFTRSRASLTALCRSATPITAPAATRSSASTTAPSTRSARRRCFRGFPSPASRPERGGSATLATGTGSAGSNGIAGMTGATGATGDGSFAIGGGTGATNGGGWSAIGSGAGSGSVATAAGSGSGSGSGSARAQVPARAQARSPRLRARVPAGPRRAGALRRPVREPEWAALRSSPGSARIRTDRVEASGLSPRRRASVRLPGEHSVFLRRAKPSRYRPWRTPTETSFA